MDPGSELRRADALHLDRKYSDAIGAYRRVLSVDAASLEAWYGLGCASLALKAYGDAAEALRRAIDLRPDAIGARCSLAEALFELGEIDAAVAEYARVTDSGDAEARAIALAAVACIAPGAPGYDNFRILAARRRWVELARRGVRPVARPPRPPGDKLRVGYLGAFFGARNWMKFVWGVINRHDRAEFEVHLLSDGADPSAESGYVDHADDRIWQISGMPNVELAQHVAGAGLDVLVDLNGYSYQNRLPLFLYRPAPLQISWMGMFGTTGFPEVEFLVTDAAALSPEEERYCCEKIVRVPGSYLAFEVLYPVPDVVPPPCLNHPMTFGCLGSAYKMNEPTLAAFAAILHGAPASRLLLRNRTLDETSNRSALLARFASLGIPPGRLVLEGGAEHAEFLHTYDRIDIALDTFPYNGGTTTAEALWQGVPVLTFNGDRWASRTSRSLLLAAGLGDWVADDHAGFVAAATALANADSTPARLVVLRAGMRQKLRASVACDAAGLCRALESLYRSPPA